MTPFEKIKRKIDHYNWLCNIAESYQDMIGLIDREKDYFTIYGFSYSARGDVTSFNVNPHRTIPNKYIKQGLEEILKCVQQEIQEIEIELKDWL